MVKGLELAIVSQTVLRDTLATRRGVAFKAELVEALAVVDEGAQSAAELRYVRDVERAHRLPIATKQAPTGLRSGRRDALYEDQAFVVELDGQLGHARWSLRVRDNARDRRAATDGLLTARAGWVDLVPSACGLARDVALILCTRGWQGQPSVCGRPGCAVGELAA